MYKPYAELIALAKAYITQEYESSSYLITDQSIVSYFAPFNKVTPNSLQQPVAPPPNTNKITPSATSSYAYNKQTSQPIQKLPAQLGAAAITPQPASIDTGHQQAKKQVAEDTASSDPIVRAPSKKSSLVKTDKRIEEVKPTFSLEPLTPAQPIDLSSIRKAMVEHFPHITILDDIPSEIRQRPSNVPSCSVLILSTTTEPTQRELLDNIGKAIEKHFDVRVEIVGLDNIASQLQRESNNKHKMIMASIEELNGNNETKQLLTRESSGKNFFANTPLISMLPPLCYIQDVSLKRTLWQTICCELKKMTEEMQQLLQNQTPPHQSKPG